MARVALVGRQVCLRQDGIQTVSGENKKSKKIAKMELFLITVKSLEAPLVILFGPKISSSAARPPNIVSNLAKS